MLLAILYLLGGAASCWEDYETPCADHDAATYTHKDFEIYNLDNSGAKAIVATETVHKLAFGIRLSIDRDKIASSTFKRKLSFSTPLYAYCPDNGYIAQDTITSIRIFTHADFDDVHTADSDVSEYYSISTTSSFSRISDYVTVHGYDRLYIQELDGNLDMLLMTAPTHNGTYQFTVEITLSDNRVIEQTTNPIDLVE